MRLAILHDCRWIEPDPSLGSFRIAPSAAPWIRQAFRQRNLL